MKEVLYYEDLPLIDRLWVDADMADIRGDEDAYWDALYKIYLWEHGEL